jgi:hypothetical protein
VEVPLAYGFGCSFSASVVSWAAARNCQQTRGGQTTEASTSQPPVQFRPQLPLPMAPSGIKDMLTSRVGNPSKSQMDLQTAGCDSATERAWLHGLLLSVGPLTDGQRYSLLQPGMRGGRGEWISAKLRRHDRNHVGEWPSRRPNCCYSCCYFCGKTCVNPCRYKIGAGEGNRTLISITAILRRCLFAGK